MILHSSKYHSVHSTTRRLLSARFAQTPVHEKPIQVVSYAASCPCRCWFSSPFLAKVTSEKERMKNEQQKKKRNESAISRGAWQCSHPTRMNRIYSLTHARPCTRYARKGRIYNRKIDDADQRHWCRDKKVPFTKSMAWSPV